MNKKQFFALSGVCLLMTAGISVTAKADTIVGDHNRDGIVNTEDAAVILRYAADTGSGLFSGTFSEYIEYLFDGKEEIVWQDAYSDKLRTYLSQCSDYDVTDPLRPMWDLKDLNGDTVPELIISTGAYHMAGVLIYTFNGSLIEMTGTDTDDGLGQWGTVSFNEENHLIYSCYDYAPDDVKPYYYYYDEVGADSLKTIASFYYGEAYDSENSTWTYNGKTVSKAEYTAKIAPYQAMDWETIGRKYEFGSAPDVG